jgi:hypothetical protein
MRRQHTDRSVSPGVDAQKRPTDLTLEERNLKEAGRDRIAALTIFRKSERL